MKNTWIVLVAALVVGAAGGYISGKNTDAGGGSTGTEEVSQRTRANARPGSTTAENSKRNTRGTSPEQIGKLAGNSSRVQALLEFYAGLTPEQLAEEATKLDALPMSERIMASFLLFGRWAEVDPTAAMAFSNTMGMAGGFVRPTILKSWASVDPANAAKYYGENSREFAMMDMMGGGRGPMGGQGASSIIAAEWARQDPAAAMAWASGLESGKGQAMTSVVAEVAKTDPRKAAEMLASMDSDDKGGAYRAVAEQYGALDFNAAQAWVRTLPADEQAEALASAIGGLSNTNPEQAALQVKSMEAGEAKDRLIGDIAGDLARKDPAAAAEFVRAQDSEDAQRRAMRDLMPAWTNTDPAAALVYVNSFKPGPVRDSAAQSYVWSNNTTPPAELVRVAKTITDDGDRERTEGIAYMRWMREDAEGAKAAVEASGLSDEAKERIVEGRGMWDGGGGRGRDRER